MKFTIDSSELKRALATVGHTVASKTTLPILQYVLIEPFNFETVQLSTTNLSAFTRLKVGATVEDVENGIALPFSLFASFVNSLPANENVTFKVIVRNNSADVQCAGYKANFKGLLHNDFPDIGNLEDGLNIAEIAVRDLIGLVNSVAHSASKDESRPALTTIEAIFAPDEITVAATDGYRLATNRLEREFPISENQVVLVESTTWASLTKVMGALDSENVVSIKLSSINGSLIVQIEDTLDFRAMTVDGRYPDYRGIIPTNWNTKILFDTKSLQNAVNVCALFGGENRIIHFEFEPNAEASGGNVKAKAHNADGEAVEVDVPAVAFSGDANNVAFNAKYLKEALGAVNGQVMLDMTQPTRPIRLVPPENENLMQVIMPMHPNR